MKTVWDFLDRPLVAVILASLAVLGFLFLILVLGNVTLLTVGFLVLSSVELGWYVRHLTWD